MNAFRDIWEHRHEYAEAWKQKSGGGVIGYFETYMPEEILYAAGILPVRIMAQHEPDAVTDRQMYGNCYPTRDMLNQFLIGRYRYVDGLVHAEGCQWIFLAYQTILNNNPDYFDHYVFVPDYPDARTSKRVLRSELEVFKNHVTSWVGREIRMEALDEAIDIYNRHRLLLRRMYELRKSDTPVLSGSEAMDIMLACQVMDKKEANAMLEQFLLEAAGRPPQEDCVRLMLIGSETWNSDLERLVEDIGANIVIDELENGTSYIWNNIIWQDDRLMAIALRYLERPHHPIKDNNWRRRPDHIYRLYEDWQADGVIIAKQIYCHPHGTDNHMVWKLLRERNIPFHFFERDLSLPQEETRERIASLIHMIEPGVNRLHGLNQIGRFSTVVGT